jgi:hypothetical protein
MADIESKLINPTSMYYQAARYYYENNKDLKQALEWIIKLPKATTILGNAPQSQNTSR